MMTRARLVIAAVVVVIAAVAGVIVATRGSSGKPVAPNSALSLELTGLGTVLVDADNRTLYLFEGDRPNVSALSGAGRAIWPPFTATAKPAANSGVSAALIGTIPAPGGAKQVTYDGHPLYYYAGDRHEEQTAGQGLTRFGGRWYVVSARGGAITAPASSASHIYGY